MNIIMFANVCAIVCSTYQVFDLDVVRTRDAVTMESVVLRFDDAQKMTVSWSYEDEELGAGVLESLGEALRWRGGAPKGGKDEISNSESE